MSNPLTISDSPLAGKSAGAQAEGYRLPPDALAALVNATPAPGVSVDGTGTWMLLMERREHPAVAELAQPELRLAGIRINPGNNGLSRRNYVVGLTLKNIRTGEVRPISGLPSNPWIADIKWAPDDSGIAFTVSDDRSIHLYTADVKTARASVATALPLNAAFGTPYYWLSDSGSLVVLLIPGDRGEAPELPPVPAGPVIQENLGRKTAAPTFQDLLKNAGDEALFDYYFTSQVAVVTPGQAAIPVGKPAVVTDAQPSPDGRYLLVQTILRPYSYLVPARLFPLQTVVTDLSGSFEKLLSARPLIENVPWSNDAVPPGPRGFSWRSDVPATVYWAEAPDGGDPETKAEVRDIVRMWPAPFDGAAVDLFRTPYRFSGVCWGNARTALFYERWWETRRAVTSLVNPADPGRPVVLYDRSSEDSYSHPGNPQFVKNRYGAGVLAITEANEIFLLGVGASPEGNRPFVDRLNLGTKATERLWRSEPPVYEQPVTMLDISRPVVLTTREAPDMFPNYYIRELEPDGARGALKQITDFPHPYPHLRGIHKEVLRYKRNDGVDLTATLYLPAGYRKEDGPLPTLLWAYPKEFKDKGAAGQVAGSPFQFNRISYWGAAAFVTRGYAVLDNATIPIVGEGNSEPNDTYLKQLVDGALAAVETGVSLGVTDPDRVAVGGHSYGAFMAANLLTHSNLFKAGIARSGAYNRTLTPFGFQNERRTYWQVPAVYNTMSPFMNADKMKSPLLLVHGEADNNPGTFPMQSERYYSALKSLGATVRLVVLPYESHGYVARESLLHMLWEMDRWLELYVKNAVAPPVPGN